MKPQKVRYNTTGGAGYVPPAPSDETMWLLNPVNAAKYRLYKNLTPGGYERLKPRIIGALKGVPDGKQSKSTSGPKRDDQWATYLGIPTTLRLLNRIKLEEAKYKPQNADPNIPLYRMPLTRDDQEELISAMYPWVSVETDNGFYYSGGRRMFEDPKDASILGFGKNEASTVLEPYFGTHIIGRGSDPTKGEYVSYYDRYDLNPYYGKNAVSGKAEGDIKLPGFIKNKIIQHGDVGMGTGITHPFGIYDRIYLSDFYGVDPALTAGDKNTYYGGWLPEIEIKPRRRSQK